MLAPELAAELRALDFAQRVIRVDELLATNHFPSDAMAHALYFKAHAQRQILMPDQALQTSEGALRLDMTNDLRAVLLECVGMSQYDLGHTQAVEETCARLGQMAMPFSVHTNWLMLRGRVLLRKRDRSGLDLFAEAESRYGSQGDEHNQAWAQLSAARLALVLGNYALASAISNRVTCQAWKPRACLVRAEASICEGNFEPALYELHTAGDLDQPPCDAVDRARKTFLEALLSIRKGDKLRGLVLMDVAGAEARSAQRLDLELIDAINALRAEACSEPGVGRC